MTRDDKPVVQHVAQARRPLRALRHQPPAPVGAAREVEGNDQQALPARRLSADHRPQPARVAQQQRGWQQALVQQRLRAVQVGQHLLQQFGALRHAGFYGRPVGGFDELRQQLQRPGACGIANLRVFAEDVVRDAVELDALRDLNDAAVEVVGHVDRTRRLRLRLRHRQRLRKTLPGVAQRASAGTQLIPHAGLSRQGVAEQRVGGGGCCGGSD